MSKTSGRKQLLIVAILGILSSIISIYLIYDHIHDADSSFCDVGNHISCSVIRRSAFSEILNVPIAIFGLFFSLTSSLVALYAIQNDKLSLFSGLYYWNIFGCAFVFYLICGEIYLQAICPFCTIVHICQVISMWQLYKVSTFKPILPLFTTIWKLKTILFFIGIIHFLPMIYFNVPGVNLGTIGNEPPITNEDFSECITNQGWIFYGLIGCGWCDKQKALFGSTLDKIKFVDCGTERELCQSIGIDGFPTWVKTDENNTEIDRWKGYCSTETWMIITTCINPYK